MVQGLHQGSINQAHIKMTTSAVILSIGNFNNILVRLVSRDVLHFYWRSLSILHEAKVTANYSRGPAQCAQDVKAIFLFGVENLVK